MSTTSPTTPLQPPSIEAVIKRRRPLRNVHQEVIQAISPLDRLALWITVRVGSMGFFLGIFGWTVCWLGWNVLAPPAWQFDPPMAFVFWLFISNVIQILLMPLIMVGQNLMGRHGEVRAEHDLDDLGDAIKKAIEAAKTIILDQAETVALADRHGISIVARDEADVLRRAG